jgi:hypothetical protein
MTDEPKHDYQASPGYPHQGGAELAHTGEPWGAHQEPGEEPGQTETTAAHPTPVRGPRMWPRIVGVLLLFVIVGGVWIWQNPGFVQSHVRWLLPGATVRDGAATESNTLDARVTRLEQGLPSGLATLTQRLNALEARLPGPGQTTVSPASPDLRPLQARLDAVEVKVAAIMARPTGTPPGPATSPATADQIAGEPDVRSLAARLDALERQQAQQTPDAARVETLQAQINALSAHNSADLSGRLDAVEHGLGEIAASQTKLAGTSDRVTRLAQVNAVEVALAAGRPLGSMTDAPPALTRFATTAPPTEAGLRLAFAAAAQQALQVSLPDTDGKPFFDRILARLQDFRLITVREGDRVVIGNSTAAILTHARVLLDVGDLVGATKAVATLTGPPAAKMAQWLADATALQAAREALASLAENG